MIAELKGREQFDPLNITVWLVLCFVEEISDAQGNDIMECEQVWKSKIN